MAYLPLSEFERQKQQQEGQSQQPILSGQSSVISSQGPSKQGGPKSSGQFTNLQSYLSANQDQAANISTQIADNIKNTAQDTRQSIQDADTQFKNQIQNSSIQGLDTAKQDSDRIINQAKSGQVGQVINEPDTQRFKSIGTAQYQGPLSLQDTELYNPLQQKVQKVQSFDNLSQTDEGRFTLLNDMFSSQKPTYSRGQKLLDNLLLSGSEVGKQKLDEARQSLTGIQGDFDNLNTQLASLGQQTKSKTDEARQYAIQNLQNSQTLRNQEVEDRLQNSESTWDDEYNQYIDLLKGYQGGQLELTEEQANRLGLQENQRLFNTLSGIQPESYLKLNEFDANKAISKDEQAQLAALDALASQLNLSGLNKYSNANLAGTLTESFDGSNLGLTATEKLPIFNQRASSTNLGASSGPIGVDEWQYNASSNVKNYLDNGQGAFGYQGYLAGRPTNIGGSYADQAYSTATQNLFNSINSWLNSEGYNNQVKIKK
jgi:hypothetical protein